MSETRNRGDLILCAALGGVGGLSPIACQAIALFLPNIIGGSDKVEQALASFPHAPSVIAVDVSVLAAVFIIAAAVALFNIDSRSNTRFRQAFFAGAAVPGLVLSFGNGFNLANGPPPSGNRSSLESIPQTAALAPTQMWAMVISTSEVTVAQATVPGNEAEVRIVVQCLKCGIADPDALIRVVRLTGDIVGDQPRTVHHDGKGLIHFLLAQVPGTVSVAIPNADENSPNEHIGHREGDIDHVDLVFQGADRRWLITVALTPDPWNTWRALFGRDARYLISNITAKPTGNS